MRFPVFLLVITMATLSISSVGLMAQACTAEQAKGWPVPANWVVRQETAEDGQRNYLESNSSSGAKQRWAGFISNMKAGDQLWYFAPPAFYDCKNICNGFLLIRECRVIASVIIEPEYMYLD
jgi:hypothetical protein